MKRLVEEQHEDPQLGEAAKLTRAAIPDEPSAATRDRIYRRVNARLDVRGARFRLSPAFALVLLFLGAFAAASIWRNVREPRPELPRPIAPAPRAVTQAAPRVVPQAPPVAPAIVAPTEPEEPSVEPKASAPATAQRARQKIAPAVVAPTASPDAALLLQRAVRALRHEQNAEQAAKLADEFLSRYPKDELYEEGLALAISAHDKLGDDRGAALAERYLARFPHGTFAKEARRVRDADSQ